MKTFEFKNKSVRAALMLFGDTAIVAFTSLVSTWLLAGFDWDSTAAYLQIPGFWLLTGIYWLTTLLVFYAMHLYHRLWNFAGSLELLYISVSCVLILAVNACLVFLQIPVALPFGWPIIAGMMQFFLTVLFRFGFRLLRKSPLVRHRLDTVPTMVVGAGETGGCVVRETRNGNVSFNRVVCLIDDDSRKIGQYMQGVKIVGNRNDIPAMVQKYHVQEIILALPSADAQTRRQILEICQSTGCKLLTLPSVCQLASGEVGIEQIRQVEIEDLLGRESISVDWNTIAGYVNDRTVLVTGGGGSIGSELCRQIAAQAPRELIIFDIYENNAYAIQQELLRQYPSMKLTVRIGSVRDAARVDSLFANHAVDIVYHAAAHKHVPLMEDSPLEAVKNNILGTRNVAEAAGRHGVSSFVMISTDKAVNPTNVMGASKRVCEMVVQQQAERFPHTKYAAVRFGNVLGSNGSVIPLFHEQIRRGGPVTVTHPDIIRYFMTIPEAVSLVLQAGAFAKGGEIFVLNMGDPVKIDDLARNMIRLSGFKPDVDIPIVYTGLRPGEKLYEELLMAEEGLTETANSMIFIGHQTEFDDAVLTDGLGRLSALNEADAPSVRGILKELVPTYHRSEAAAPSTPKNKTEVPVS